MIGRKNSRKQRKTKADECEEELESIFQQLKETHESKFSGPQLRLWIRIIVAKMHDDMDKPLKVPIITIAVQKIQPKESLADAFASVATAVAKVVSHPIIFCSCWKSESAPSPGINKA